MCSVSLEVLHGAPTNMNKDKSSNLCYLYIVLCRGNMYNMYSHLEESCAVFLEMLHTNPLEVLHAAPFNGLFAAP